MDSKLREADIRTYEDIIKPWLPERIFDIHVHVSLQEHFGPVDPERYRRNWAMEVGVDNPWQTLRSTYERLFPDQEVHAMVFGGVYREMDIDRENSYVLLGSKHPANRARPLLVTRPEDSPESIVKAFSEGFIGIKPYPDLALADTEEISIFDFLPKPQLDVLDELGGVLMLHIPRSGRLGDEDNIRELLELHDQFPNVRLIVAHIGRSYTLTPAKKGLPRLASAKGIYFDTSANLNADVFHFALETLGPGRILYGSDLPVTLMRGVREYDGDRYINYTDGTWSWNTNRKSPDEESRYTSYLYEELKALIDALTRAGMGRDEMEQICWSNSAHLLGIENS